MAWRILITGATGCLGSEILRRLHHREVEFVAACRQGESVDSFPNLPNLSNLELPGIQYLPLDYNEPASLEQAFRGVDLLFLLLPFSESMLYWAEDAVRAAQKAGVKVILRSSVMGADARSSFLWQRIEGEMNDLLLRSGIPAVIMKSNHFMQNFTRFYGSALEQGALYLPEGDGRVSFVDVGDVASVIVEALINPFKYIGKSYTLTGPRALSNAEALAVISEKMRRNISYVPVTEESTLRVLEKMQASKWWMELMLSRHRSVREGQLAAVTSTFTELTGREPRSFEEFAAEIELDVGVDYGQDLSPKTPVRDRFIRR